MNTARITPPPWHRLLFGWSVSRLTNRRSSPRSTKEAPGTTLEAEKGLPSSTWRKTQGRDMVHQYIKQGTGMAHQIVNVAVILNFLALISTWRSH